MKSKRIIAALMTIMMIPLCTGRIDAVSKRKTNRIMKKAAYLYKSLKRRHGWHELGRSVRNRKIYYIEYGKGDKVTMIIGGIHGDEPAGMIASIRLAQYIRKHHRSINSKVVIIPCANPDGLFARKRSNANDVDLNRNFPTPTWSPVYEKDYHKPGDQPASEPETVLIANVIEKYRPALIIQLHQPYNAIYPDEGVPEELVNKMSKITGIEVKKDLGYETPGSLSSMVPTMDYKLHIITLELTEPDREPNYRKITKSLIEAINY